MLQAQSQRLLQLDDPLASAHSIEDVSFKERIVELHRQAQGRYRTDQFTNILKMRPSIVAATGL